MLSVRKSLGQRISESMLVSTVNSVAFRVEEIPSATLLEAVRRLLVSIGECRLFGGDLSALSELDGKLSFLTRGKSFGQVDGLVDDLSQKLATYILEDLDRNIAKAEAMDKLTSVVDQQVFLLERLEIWAMWLAVNDEEESFMSEQVAYSFLSQARSKIDRLDQIIKKNARCLADAFKTTLIETLVCDLVLVYNQWCLWIGKKRIRRFRRTI